MSLLPVGIISIEGQFQRGDIVQLADETGQLQSLGIAEYGAEKALERLGQQHQHPLVHYDLFLNPDLG